MNDSVVSFAPALGLLALMVLLAWGVQWVRKRMAPVGSGEGADLRLVSQLALGPQQRVVVVEVSGPSGPVQLTLGVTPQQISVLHTQPVAASPARPAVTVAPPTYEAVAQAIKRNVPGAGQ